jgi:hypothetical protein
MRTAPLLMVAAGLAMGAVLAGGACSSSSSAGVADAGVDTAPANQCTAYGQGYECQPGPSCKEGFVDKEDYFCGSTGDLCCGPIGDGGSDGSDDANVFVDGAVFETGVADARHDGATHDGAVGDAGHADATTHPDAGADSGSQRDAGAPDSGARHDAGEPETGAKPEGGVKSDARSSEAGPPRDAGDKAEAGRDAKPG